MKKITKLSIIAGGLVIGLSSIAPLTTYAATGSSTVSVSVSPVITIDATSPTGTINANPNAVVDTGKISATITTNKAYYIQLSVASSDKTSLTATGTTDKISSIVTAGPLTVGSNTWGIKKKGSNTTSNTTDDANYSPITTSATTFYTGAAGATGVKTEFTVGVAVSPTLTAGSYTTDVIITAINQS